MIENSSHGLVMLESEVPITVTREDRHQSVLARYPVGPRMQREVAVELGPCIIESGKYRGSPAIEVRLDGMRVGELTYLMSQRYAGLLDRVAAHGGRPGCEAVIERGAKGLEITLRLPRHAEGHAPPPPYRPRAGGPSYPPAGAPAYPAPVPSRAPAAGVTVKRPAWLAAAAVAVVVFVVAIAANDDSTPTAATGADRTTTSTAPPTTTTRFSTPAPTTATATVAPVPTPVAPPPAPVTTPKPAPPPVALPPQPVVPEPAPSCDPNYTGCVPVASDVDCAGGSGNGPEYVAGPIRVIGADIYDLDRDSDGIACE